MDLGIELFISSQNMQLQIAAKPYVPCCCLVNTGEEQLFWSLLEICSVVSSFLVAVAHLIPGAYGKFYGYHIPGTL